MSDHIPDLWKQIAINNLLPKSQYKILLYNIYCPSIKSNIKDRVYLSIGDESISALLSHYIIESRVYLNQSYIIESYIIDSISALLLLNATKQEMDVVEEIELKEVQDNKETEEDKIIVEDEYPIINILELLHYFCRS